MPTPEAAEWDLPRLRASFTFQDDFKYLPAGDDTAQEFFDVKFYPYNPLGAPPIFAATSKKHVVVCRLTQLTDRDTNPCEVLRVIRDDDAAASNCACCWSRDPVTQRAWLCVAGNDAKVKVYNVRDGVLVKTLVGHGGGINDLATSPANPLIVASASDDTTVRIWSLAAEHERQPCVCLLGGEGHSWDLLSVAFHDSGRYVLSAGHDQVINLWAIPELPKEHVDVPIVVHYPHFSSSEIHSNLVDCVAFYGDLILSRACHEDCIVLWRIEGFSSSDPVPGPEEAPTTFDPSKQTRTCFAPVLSAARPAPFTRLLQFHTPDCSVQFFMRFRMFHAPNRHPILAFANAKSRTMFWDMSRFPAYENYMSELREAHQRVAPSDGPPPPIPVKPSWLVAKRAPPKKPPVPGDSSHLRSFTSSIGGGGGDGASMVSASPDPEGTTAATQAGLGMYDKKTLADWAEMYDMGNSHGLVKAHKAVQTDGGFVGRQVGWSPDGDWCVVVGNANRALLYHRWPKDKGAAAAVAAASAPAN